ALAGPPFESLGVLSDLLVEPGGQLPAGGEVGAAGVGRDREAGGNRNAELRHLREADPFASQELTAPVAGLVVVVDVAGRHSGQSSHKPPVAIRARRAGRGAGGCRSAPLRAARPRSRGAAGPRRAPEIPPALRAPRSPRPAASPGAAA